MKINAKKKPNGALQLDAFLATPTSRSYILALESNKISPSLQKTSHWPPASTARSLSFSVESCPPAIRVLPKTLPELPDCAEMINECLLSAPTGETRQLSQGGSMHMSSPVQQGAVHHLHSLSNTDYLAQVGPGHHQAHPPTMYHPGEHYHHAYHHHQHPSILGNSGSEPNGSLQGYYYENGFYEHSQGFPKYDSLHQHQHPSVSSTFVASSPSTASSSSLSTNSSSSSTSPPNFAQLASPGNGASTTTTVPCPSEPHHQTIVSTTTVIVNNHFPVTLPPIHCDHPPPPPPSAGAPPPPQSAQSSSTAPNEMTDFHDVSELHLIAPFIILLLTRARALPLSH